MSLAELKKHPGQKPGTFVFEFNKFLYHKDPRNGKKFNCASATAFSKCPCVLRIVQKKNILVDEDLHNHPQPNTLPRRKVIQNIKTNSLTHSPNEAVARTYINESPPSIKEVNASKAIIYRLRKSDVPQPPETISLLLHSIKNYNFLKNNYLGSTVTTDGSVAFFFTNLILLKALSVVEEINVAASHLSVPRSPGFSQLLTFRFEKNNQSIPALFIICSTNSAEIYSAIWDFLGSKITKLKKNLKRIVCNYENDFIIATKKKLPKVQIRGSWFHFIKLWTRQWRSLNLSMEPLPIILKIAWAVPLLPAEKLQEGMKVLEFFVNCQGYNIKLKIFLSRLKAWVLQLSSELSFYDNMEEGAINVAEDFLRQIIRLLGHQKSLHTYLGNIVKVLNKSSDQCLSRDEAQKIPRKTYQIKVDNTIRSFQSQLMKKKISTKVFLNSVIDKVLAGEILIQLAHKQYELDDGSLWSNIPNPQLFKTSSDSTDSASTSNSTSDSDTESRSNLDTTSDNDNRGDCNNTYDSEFENIENSDSENISESDSHTTNDAECEDIINDSDEDMFYDDN